MALLDSWRGLEKRERTLLGWGALIATAILIWVIMIEPWQARLDQLRAQVPAKRQTFFWMESESAEIGKLLRRARQFAADDSSPLLTIVEQTAQQSGIRGNIRRIQPDEQTAVNVWLTEAYFDDWIRWVDILRARSIVVSSATVTRDKDNRVNVRMSLQRA